MPAPPSLWPPPQPLIEATVAIVVSLALLAAALTALRMRARAHRRYVRLRVIPYRGDDPPAQGIVSMFEALHKRLQRRWWRRLYSGQPSLGLEVHYDGREAWFALTCPAGSESIVQSALRGAYPSCRLRPDPRPPGAPPCLLRLKKHSRFIKRAKRVDRFEHDRSPAVVRLLTAIAACEEPAFVQIALTPTPALFEGHSKRVYKHHENHLSRARKLRLPPLDRSMVEDDELKGGLHVQHRPLFFADIRIVAQQRAVCERIASELRAACGENRLVERGTLIRHGLLGLYDRRVSRGEGNPLPSYRKGVFASTELSVLWHLPSLDYSAVPFERSSLPIAPAPPAIMRPSDGLGTLADEYGPVTIHPSMRRQNTAVPGTVEQGKSSYLAATVAEDLRRERCAIVVLDPKGDAAEAAVSLVPEERTCTLLDFSHPTCGFNPLAVDAPADTIADYVVEALKNLFDPGDIKASSDRYLRNAIIAVLAYDRHSTLWDAARLLSVGEDGYAYRARVAARLRTQPEFKEISEFFTGELSAQLADARGTTTAKLDAPVNKLARLLNSPSIKRVLLNDSLRVSFDEVISGCEVLVVKGALGTMGAGNTSVLMQLLVGMLDAALARQQDGVGEHERIAVALKVDEAPLVLGRGFAETMALKRSAGLETVACWQTNSQWIDRDVRSQLDALFAHRVYFATASVSDARDAAALTMANFSDTVRPDIRNLAPLGHPEVRLHLPRHHAIVSWVTREGRQPPFIARTLPLRVDAQRLAHHAARQAARGGRYLDDLSQPHWNRPRRVPHAHADTNTAASTVEPATSPASPAPRLESAEAPIVPVAPRLESVEPPAAPALAGPASTPDARAKLSSEPPSTRAESSLTPGESSTPPTRAEASSTRVEVPSPPAESRLEPAEPSAAPPATPVPSAPAESYGELVNLAEAHSVRRAASPDTPRQLRPEPLDLEMLALVYSLRHVLSSQIHRRFNPARAATTTQRRLKRLADAGLVLRLQFHRRDGGGMPMCYSIAPAGRELLVERGSAWAADLLPESCLPESASQAPPNEGRNAAERLLRQARHDVRAAGWALALERALADRSLWLLGPDLSTISPPTLRRAEGTRMLARTDLALPEGRSLHDFLRTDSTGQRVEVERFESVRPDVTLRCGDGQELLIELDDRLPEGAAAAKLERYDHFLSGWSTSLKRYARSGSPLPLVVFVCRDRPRARECARRADQVLVASRAYAGERPSDWLYPGRQNIVFAAERDAHEGLLCAWGIPPLPPAVRAQAAGGDPRSRDPMLQAREIALG